jgi:hypothetical protein
MPMKLLPKALAEQLPALYSQEDKEDPLVLAHFFCSANGWDWFIWEGSLVDEDGVYDSDRPKVDYLFFGLVCGFEDEIGYASLSELESARLVERDLHWHPKTLSEVRADIDKRRTPPELIGMNPEANRRSQSAPPLFASYLEQHRLVARETALEAGEKIGWDIVASMDITPDLAGVYLDDLNQARKNAGLSRLDARQEEEYRQVFVRTWKNKRPSPEQDEGSSRAFTVEPISLNELTHPDLCRLRDLKLRRDWSAYSLTALDRTSTGEALYIPGLRRLGIAWDGGASWAEDVPDVQTGVQWWLEEPDNWRRHNH